MDTDDVLLEEDFDDDGSEEDDFLNDYLQVSTGKKRI